MNDLQNRVVDEKLALEEKLNKLFDFIRGEEFPALPKDERDRLHRQFGVMTLYSEVLAERIAEFPE